MELEKTYKIMQGMINWIEGSSFPSHKIPEPWGHPLQWRVRTDKRKCFFTQHVVSLWNSLPRDVMMASGIDVFKRGLDRFLEEKSIAG